MLTILAVAIFGILGCWARFYLTGRLQAALGRGFPWATLIINVSGSVLMGFLSVLLVQRVPVSPALQTGILTGFIGGYTTFSTFAMEALLLAEEAGAGWKSALYVGTSVLLGVLGAALGGAVAFLL